MTPILVALTQLSNLSREHIYTADSDKYDPRRDPTLIVLAVLVFGTLAVGVLGFGATPVLDDDEGDGTVFPIQDWREDGPDEVRLVVDADRTTIGPGDSIAFTVSDEEGTAMPDAHLHVDGERYELDDEGRVDVTFDRGGEFTVRADRDDTDETRYVADGTIVSVERDDVPLDIATGAETVTAGEDVTVSLRRGDTDEAIAGTVDVDGERYETGPNGRATIPTERAGTYELTASSARTDTERFLDATTTVTVERRSVGLSVSLNEPEPRVGESVTLSVRRADTNTPIDATVEVDGDRRVAEGGELSLTADRATRFDLSVTAPDTDRETFETETQTIRFERYDAPLSLDASPTTVERGETVTFRATRTDTGEPVPGAITMGERTEWLDWQGGVSLSFEEPGTVPVTVTRANTTTHTFPTDTVTVSVRDTVYESSDVSAPRTVERGADATAEVTVRNTGSDAGTATVVYAFDGDERTERIVAIGPGATETVSFTIPTNVDAGEYDHTVTTRDDEATAAIRITDSGE